MRVFAHHRYTWGEYLAHERASNVKHEFFGGEIFAMAGGTPEHAALAAAVIRDLGGQLRTRPCLAYTSDLRVRVATTGLATYPDVTVLCGELQCDPNDPNTALNPTVIVEVLSNSTEEYDRGEKFEHYQQIATLQEYVLISHREPCMEVFRRSPAGTWVRGEARLHATLQLESIGCELSTDDIYSGITLHRG